MKNVSSPTTTVPEGVGMKPVVPIAHAVKQGYEGHNDPGKAEAYRTAGKAAADLAAARKKCRELVDLTLRDTPESAALLARALIEVGAAASRDLGDRSSTAFLLGHLSRRIREGSYIDF